MTAAATELDARTTALLANFSAAQIKQARRCIEAGGVQPTEHRGEWHVTASKGGNAYLTAIDACGCRAGQMNRYCWHRAAVILLYAGYPFDLGNAA